MAADREDVIRMTVKLDELDLENQATATQDNINRKLKAEAAADAKATKAAAAASTPARKTDGGKDAPDSSDSKTPATQPRSWGRSIADGLGQVLGQKLRDALGKTFGGEGASYLGRTSARMLNSAAGGEGTMSKVAQLLGGDWKMGSAAREGESFLGGLAGNAPKAARLPDTFGSTARAAAGGEGSTAAVVKQAPALAEAAGGSASMAQAAGAAVSGGAEAAAGAAGAAGLAELAGPIGIAVTAISKFRDALNETFERLAKYNPMLARMQMEIQVRENAYNRKLASAESPALKEVGNIQKTFQEGFEPCHG